mmetsp:Transcript_33057/g.69612  ORF Transcript_33057/g.69612 Transcript_33057/m.69612 type:complete len:80 (-) Transcript_33057:61-300(-)
MAGTHNKGMADFPMQRIPSIFFCHGERWEASAIHAKQGINPKINNECKRMMRSTLGIRVVVFAFWGERLELVIASEVFL